MRRRTKPEQETRRDAPAWTRSFLAGAKHTTELTGSRDMAVWLPALRAARYEWCQENGCYSAGTKTCEEVFGRRCSPPRTAQ